MGGLHTACHRCCRGLTYHARGALFEGPFLALCKVGKVPEVCSSLHASHVGTFEVGCAPIDCPSAFQAGCVRELGLREHPAHMETCACIQGAYAGWEMCTHAESRAHKPGMDMHA